MSRDVVARVLACDDCQHPHVLALQREPLAAQARHYVEGVELQLLPDLELFVAKRRFMHGVERRIEAAHAMINRKASGARRRAEAWDSLAMRMPEIRRRLDCDPAFIDELAMLLSEGRSPKRLGERLGFAQHPAVANAESSWSAQFRRAIYHCDYHTLFHTDMLQLQKPAPPGPPARAPAYVADAEASLEDAGPPRRVEFASGGDHAALLRLAALKLFEDRLRADGDDDDQKKTLLKTMIFS